MARAGPWSKINPPLSDFSLKAIERFGFTEMSPVQAAAIPYFMKYSDVVVKAPTGSGKTLAFVIPIVEQLMSLEKHLTKLDVGAIILSPTRELAHQTYEVVEKFCENLYLTHTRLIGGINTIEQDINNYRKNGGNIIVATPGRLNQILDKIKIKSFEMLILDEADRLLIMGFRAVLDSIINKLPRQRRTGLFSATLTPEVEDLVKVGLRNPVNVNVEVKEKNLENAQLIPSSLNNYYTIMESHEKVSQLVNFIQKNKDKKIIVYFMTCATVKFFYVIFKEMKIFDDIMFDAIHGRLETKKRMRIVDTFHKCDKGVLFATDVAARGLDFSENPVNWVIQFDPPQDSDFFIHRIGRTARMGADGNALVYLLPSEDSFINFLKLKKVPMIEMPKDDVKDIVPEMKECVRRDKEFVDMGQVAFVSFIRAYKEHNCSYLFVLKMLNFVNLLNMFGMLKIPTMPELRRVDFTGFVEEDIFKIPYRNAKKEKERIEQSASFDKRQKKKERKVAKKMSKIKKKLMNSALFENEVDEDEIDEDYKLLNKYKKNTNNKILDNKFDIDKIVNAKKQKIEEKLEEITKKRQVKASQNRKRKFSHTNKNQNRAKRQRKN